MGAAHDTPALGATLGFMRLLWALDHALQKRSKRMTQRWGITGPQRLALRVVGRLPGISAGDLADALKLDPSTLTGVLQRLVAAGFLARKVDRSDRRRVRLDLTARGRAMTADSAGSIESVVRAVLRDAAPADRRAAERLLRALVVSLDPDSPPAAGPPPRS